MFLILEFSPLLILVPLVSAVNDVGSDGVKLTRVELIIGDAATAVICFTAKVVALVHSLVTQSILPVSRSQ